MSNQQPKIIGVSGGSGSGKTTLVRMLRERCRELLGLDLLVLQVDHYYNDMAHLPEDERDARNYDHPDAFDTALLSQHLSQLLAGKSVARPTYDYATHTRTADTVEIKPAPIIVLDGILTLHWPEIRDLLTLSVYVDVDDDVRCLRRLRRDIRERGRNVDGVIHQYLATVKPMHDSFIAPQKLVADIIVSWMNYNERAVAMLAGMVAAWGGGGASTR
ncbi:MAG: uridine kinase [Deltaproteobacteria bacterium]|nr:uridine kinase [Deltaproteobacteria bacterium]